MMCVRGVKNIEYIIENIRKVIGLVEKPTNDISKGLLI